MRFYKVKALFKLGIEDLFKNMNVFIYVLMPLGFALLYSNIGGGSSESLFALCVLLNIAMVPVALMGTVIKKKKEKNTLRTLMLNDVKGSEILFAKAIICMLFVLVNDILMYFIFGLPMSSFLVYQGITLLVGLAVIFFGAFVGLLAKSQMSAGLLSLAFMVLFMAPMFVAMFGNDLATKISSLLPTDAMMTILTKVSENSVSLSSVGMPFIVIIAWFVLSIIFFNIAYKKVGVDN